MSTWPLHCPTAFSSCVSHLQSCPLAATTFAASSLRRAALDIDHHGSSMTLSVPQQ
eukprot:CAMPEP_0117021758 /NCGR_PEP_ID=MMETSP0472-20121206/16387_1 /TAXON_ID=693140 ORGANISM="Tiarina fusus, Strain LIS" /NCGR_SAMPLE_ID=MMETSP0472 /ASSEMBLY_ACC=CAM_ASM_000603 /LENGTH=55 /DNA_ID=CAMNT_0004727345 /DNA_START=88 /DNA_END=252 /DNA_ORIENTATION=+